MAQPTKLQKIDAWVTKYNKSLEKGRRKFELSRKAKTDLIRIAAKKDCSFDHFLEKEFGPMIKKMHAEADSGPSYEDMLAAARGDETIH